MTATLSVCIAYYRGQRFIGDCLQSLSRVLAGAHLSWELLVFDNECSDASRETLDVATRGLSADSVDVLRTGENLGFGRANNRLIQRARGDLILLLNQDTRFEDIDPDSISSLRDSQDYVLVPALYNADGTIQPNEFRFPTTWKYLLEVFGFTRVLQLARFCYHRRRRKHLPYAAGTTYPSGAAVFIPRALFKKYGAFDEWFFMYHEECEFFKRLSQSGRVMILVDNRIRITHFGSGSVPLSPMLHAEWYCNLAYLMAGVGRNTRRCRMLIHSYLLALRIRQLLTFLGFNGTCESPTERVYRHARQRRTRRAARAFIKEARDHACRKLRSLDSSAIAGGKYD